MKYLQHFMAVIAMSAMLIACNKGQRNTQVQDEQLVSPMSADTTAMEKNNDQNDKSEQFNTGDTIAAPVISGNSSSNTTNNADWDKKIIKPADIQLQLNDYSNFNNFIHSSLQKFGAYIADEKQTQNDYKIENNITIKVPVSQFDNLINSLNGKGITITEKNISSNDVTGEVLDTKSRMLAKMAVRDKYLQLLKQAKNMNEILQVQNEINSIQEDIESANGRVSYLQHSSAYSTVYADYFQYVNGKSANDEKPDFFTKLCKAFSIGTSVISNLILFCISIWPLI